MLLPSSRLWPSYSRQLTRLASATTTATPARAPLVRPSSRISLPQHPACTNTQTTSTSRSTTLARPRPTLRKAKSTPIRRLCLCCRPDLPEMSVAGGASSVTPSSEYRLPTNVVPRHYDLAFKTDLDNQRFSGEALIDLDVAETSKNIVFNLEESCQITHISIGTTEAKSSAAVRIPLSALAHDKKQERTTVDLAALPGGQVVGGSKIKLFVRWEAPLGDNMVGYYKSDGDADENGKKPM